MTALPFSQACENNKHPILAVLKRHLHTRRSVLEIGAGTGQHAEFLAANFPNLQWQASDVPEHVADLNRRIINAALPNLPPATRLDVNDPDWQVGRFDAIFTANSLHIMSMDSVEKLFAGVTRHLAEQSLLLVYGPFRYNGDFTTASNARFDLWLKQQNPVSGVRDFEWVNSLAQAGGLQLLEDNAMPANNQLLVWLASGTAQKDP